MVICSRSAFIDWYYSIFNVLDKELYIDLNLKKQTNADLSTIVCFCFVPKLKRERFERLGIPRIVCDIRGELMLVVLEKCSSI